MSDTLIIAILASVPATIASGASMIAAYMTIKTHKVVNGGMLVQLKLHAETSKALVALKDSPENIAIAALAQKMLIEHEDKLA